MKQKIKKGDWVRIINPEFFIRCGYPLCLGDAQEKIKEKHGKRIDDFINKTFESESVADYSFNVPNFKIEQCYDRILMALSRHYVYLNGFGGKERKIYTKNIPEHKDKIYRVAEKSYKVTGHYCAGYSGYSYEGEYDCEPAYLEDQKRRTLLHLSQYTVENWPFQLAFSLEEFDVIEDIYVEKVEKGHPAILAEQKE